MDLLSIVSDLVPEGRPDFRNVIKYPTIRQLVEREGKKKIFAILAILVRDFCASINVVRNMNEDQIIETAAMLLDECGNFRLEDYVMMFAMAKRGGLVKIYDRLDINVVNSLLDAYWQQRSDAGKRFLEEEVQHLDQIGPTQRIVDSMHPDDAKLVRLGDNFAGALSHLKSSMADLKPAQSDIDARSQVSSNPGYKNPYSKPE